MIIAVDFDGTIVRHRYPKIGEEIPFATSTLRMLIQDRHRLILWTVREGELLDEAVEWCRARGVVFYPINRALPVGNIEDRSFGGLPDWGTIYHRISEGKALEADWGLLTSGEVTERERPGFFARLFGAK